MFDHVVLTSGPAAATAQGMLIAIIALPDAFALEIAAVARVFDEASRGEAPIPYRVVVVAEDLGSLRCASGLRILADATFDDCPEPIDTFIVVGTRGIPRQPSKKLTEWVQRHATSARRYASLCSGAFVLGAAGLLDGRRVATHWEYEKALAAAFPAAFLEPDRMCRRDGPMITSAGQISAVDLALSLIEEDAGKALSLAIARRLVVYFWRPDDQSQQSPQLAAQIASSTPINRAQNWARENTTADLSVASLARRVGMSERNFARAFRAQTGMTPGEFVDVIRVDRARVLFDGAALSVRKVARASGFSDSESLHRAFVRVLKMNGRAYLARCKSPRAA